MTIIVPGTVRSMNLYEPTGTLSELKKPVDYISKVKVIGLKMLRPNGKTANIPVRLSSREFFTLQKMEITMPDDKAETRQKHSVLSVILFKEMIGCRMQHTVGKCTNGNFPITRQPL